MRAALEDVGSRPASSPALNADHSLSANGFTIERRAGSGDTPVRRRARFLSCRRRARHPAAPRNSSILRHRHILLDRGKYPHAIHRDCTTINFTGTAPPQGQTKRHGTQRGPGNAGAFDIRKTRTYRDCSNTNNSCRQPISRQYPGGERHSKNQTDRTPFLGAASHAYRKETPC